MFCPTHVQPAAILLPISSNYNYTQRHKAIKLLRRTDFCIEFSLPLYLNQFIVLFKRLFFDIMGNYDARAQLATSNFILSCKFLML